MLIKFNADSDFVDTLKKHTGENVASKAFRVAAERTMFQAAVIRGLNADVVRLRDELEACKQIIVGARFATTALLERVGQDDIFIDLN